MTRWVAVLVALALSACTPAAPDDSQSSAEAVLASREALGDPMVKLASETIALADAVDAARHELPRGTEVLDAVEALDTRITAVQDAADAAEAAAADAPVTEAAEIVRAAAESARTTAESAGKEQSFLAEVADVDVVLNRAAETWDQPGSQTEVRARLLQLAEDLQRQGGLVGALEPQPAQCRMLIENRRAWLKTVRERTLKLQAQANSAGGTRYDELRAAYRRLPLGDEPRTADRADRACWLDASEVATSADEVRGAVDDLEAALSG